jgi:hypothetical protein
MIVRLIGRVSRAFQRGDASAEERAALQQALQGLRSEDDLPADAHELLIRLERRAS